MRPVRIRVERAGEVAERDFPSSPIQIGRNPRADLSLPFEIVSNWHAIIQFDEREASFHDLGSTNGTEYNGQQVGPGQEVPFDVQPVSLRIGEITLTLRRVGESASSGKAAVGTIATSHTEPMLTPSPRVEAMLTRLQPHYEQYDAIRRRFDDALGRELAALPADERDAASDWVHRVFPPSPGINRRGSGGEGVGVGEQLLPFGEVPTTADGARDLIRQVGEMMTICAKGLVELQEGQERIGREFGVKAVKHYSGLRFAVSAQEALAYLFSDTDPEEHRRRVGELSAAFSDTMSHQIATINGVIAGARALLDELEPGSIEREADPGRLTRFRDCWNTFVSRWDKLIAEDRKMLAVLFGPEFARVYSEVGGELSAAWQRNMDEHGPAGLMSGGTMPGVTIPGLRLPGPAGEVQPPGQLPPGFQPPGPAQGPAPVQQPGQAQQPGQLRSPGQRGVVGDVQDR